MKEIANPLIDTKTIHPSKTSVFKCARLIITGLKNIYRFILHINKIIKHI